MPRRTVATTLLALMIASSTALAAPAAPSNPALVRHMLEAWQGGDGTALGALLADDVEWTITGRSDAAGTLQGKAELMRRVLAPFGERFAAGGQRFRPVTVHGVYADGDMVVAHFDGTGIANDGIAYDNSYVWLLTLREGKIVRAVAFFDSIAFNELWRRVEPARPGAGPR